MSKYEDLYAKILHLERVTSPKEGKLTRDLVSEALGISASRLQRIKAIVKAATNTEISIEDQFIARQALANMNETDNVYGNWVKIRHLSNRTRKPPPPINVRSNRGSINRAIDSMNGIVYGLNRITLTHSRLTTNQIDEWVDGLSKIRRELETTINKLRAYKAEEFENGEG